MKNLRVLLRYGIAGYLVLLCDIFFVASFIGYEKTFDVIGRPGIGAIFATVGLPVGWLCYQITDYLVHREGSKENESYHIKQMRKIDKNLKRVNRTSYNNKLNPNALRVVENSVVPLDSIERRYSNQYLSRKVMGLSLIILILSM